MRNTRFALAVTLLLCAAASAALGADERDYELRPGRMEPEEAVGLYPIALPAGQEQLQPKLAAQLHDGAAALPHLRAFDLIPRGSCLPAEGKCLAAAARSAGLSQMVSAQVDAAAQGYRFQLRLFDAKDGGLRNEHAAQVQGGPLDLAGALEHGVCTLLGAAPCVGALRVRSEPGIPNGTHLLIDGQDRGALPLAEALHLPVGRHVVGAGGDERRVRVSYGRDTRLLCAARPGGVALLDDPAALAASPAQPAPISPALLTLLEPAPQEPARAQAGRLLLAGGAALLAVAAGLELYAQTQSSSLDDRYRKGQLTAADRPRYGQVQAAGTGALLAGATGAGALLTGGALWLFTPTGVAARF